MTRARVRQYVSVLEMSRVYANSTAAPLPTAEPGIHHLANPCPLFLVPVTTGLGMVLDALSCLPCLMKTLQKEEMSRSNLNPSSQPVNNPSRLLSICPGCQNRPTYPNLS
jgi:hypothetical protein